MAKRKARSIRGEVVDFDLLKVKQSIEGRRKPESAELREKYLDIRRRRNPRRNVSDLVREQNQNAADARDKIEQSKRNALKAAEEAKNAPDESPVEVADVVEVPAEMGKPVGHDPKSYTDEFELRHTGESTVEITPTDKPEPKKSVKKIAKRTSKSKS